MNATALNCNSVKVTVTGWFGGDVVQREGRTAVLHHGAVHRPGAHRIIRIGSHGEGDNAARLDLFGVFGLMVPPVPAMGVTLKPLAMA